MAKQLHEFIEFDDKNRIVYIDDESHDILEVEYHEITSIEMSEIIRSQLSYIREEVSIQLDERLTTMSDQEYKSWSFSARRFINRLNRQIRLCDAKRGALGKSKKHHTDHKIGNALIAELRNNVTDEIFKSALASAYISVCSEDDK